MHSHISLERISHRPWPIPAERWRWRQTWHDLLFIHWPVPVDVLRPHVPAPLSIDTRGGAAWLSLVPFRMSGVTLRGMPALPWLSAFPEMNLRTYVTFGGKPGVVFLRMDAARLAAVLTARWTLGLPYVWSRMRVDVRGESVSYRSHARRLGVTFEAAYAPAGPVFEAAADSLEAFLTERYCLYTVRFRQLWRMDIHHWPWPLQPATLNTTQNTIARAQRLPGPSTPSLLHFAKRIDVVGWLPELLMPMPTPVAERK